MRYAGRLGAAAWPGCVAILILACLAGVARPAAAEEASSSFYLGVRGIGGFAQINDVSASGFAGPLVINHDSDVVGGLGAVLGYAVARLPIRLELEVAHRFRFDFDVRDDAPGNGIGTKLNVATTSALVSAIVEWRNRTDFTPFFGAGIGWARNSAEVDRVAVNTLTGTSRDEDKDNLAWGATAGIDWAFADNWVAEAAYRYTDLGEVDSGIGVAGDRVTADEHISHDLLLSVLYRF